MAEAAYATGPALLSSIFFVPCFSAGSKQCASAGPQRAQVPQKTRGPKTSAPYVLFLFPVLVFQRGAPKSPRSPENVIGPHDLKIEAPKCGGPNDLFVPCFSAGSRQRGALKSPRPPKAKPQKRRGSKKRSRVQKIIGFRKFRNLQQTVILNAKRSLNFVEGGRSLYGRYHV